jgi:hypothetical protein
MLWRPPCEEMELSHLREEVLRRHRMRTILRLPFLQGNGMRILRGRGRILQRLQEADGATKDQVEGNRSDVLLVVPEEERPERVLVLQETILWKLCGDPSDRDVQQLQPRRLWTLRSLFLR